MALKKKRVFISDDTLREIVRWIPRPNLPNINLVNRRYWRFCEPLIQGLWPHFVGRLRISGKPNGRADFTENQVELIQGKERKFVPLACIEPPKSILGIRVVHIRDIVTKEALQFFSSTKALFTDCVLTFRDLHSFLGCDKKCPGLLKEFMASFTKCYKIEILKPSRLANEQFFTRPEILGCQRLFIWDAQPDFQLTSVFKWLHSSKTPDQRWLLIDARFSPIEMVVEFIEKLKQEFDDDADRRSFVVQIYPPDRLPVFLNERLKTEEVLVLYRVPNKLSYRLKRCPRKEAPDDVNDFVQDAAPQIPYFPFFLKAMADRSRAKVYVGSIQGYEQQQRPRSQTDNSIIIDFPNC